MSEIPATTPSSSSRDASNEPTRKVLYTIPNKGMKNRRTQQESHISSDDDETSLDETKQIIVHQKYLESNI